ncbi:MAG: 50S ribosomal protein L17 [Opitutales bacterium]|nr:50S ribosomal protein L17 [Opitutales bacterium]
MRHLKHRHQLGRTKEHRAALMANLASALITHGRIRTTLAKAKALRPFVEKIITLAVKAQGSSPERSLHFRRLAVARIRDRQAVHLLFNEKAGEFKDRPGGYTRIYKLGNRIGDAAEMAVIQLIPGSDTGYEKRKASSKKAASAATEAAAPSGESEAAAEPEAVEESAKAAAEAGAEAADEASSDEAEKKEGDK